MDNLVIGIIVEKCEDKIRACDCWLICLHVVTHVLSNVCIDTDLCAVNSLIITVLAFIHKHLIHIDTSQLEIYCLCNDSGRTLPGLNATVHSVPSRSPCLFWTLPLVTQCQLTSLYIPVGVDIRLELVKLVISENLPTKNTRHGINSAATVMSRPTYDW